MFTLKSISSISHGTRKLPFPIYGYRKQYWFQRLTLYFRILGNFIGDEHRGRDVSWGGGGEEEQGGEGEAREGGEGLCHQEEHYPKEGGCALNKFPVSCLIH